MRSKLSQTYLPHQNLSRNKKFDVNGYERRRRALEIRVVAMDL
jgi:hypothetical protein